MTTISRITTDILHDKIKQAAQTAAPLFNLYGWTYGENRVPTLNELEDCITRITQTAIDSFYRSDEEYRDAEVGSGRFSVKIREFEEEVDVRIALEIGGNTWFKA